MESETQIIWKIPWWVVVFFWFISFCNLAWKQQRREKSLQKYRKKSLRMLMYVIQFKLKGNYAVAVSHCGHQKRWQLSNNWEWPYGHVTMWSFEDLLGEIDKQLGVCWQKLSDNTSSFLECLWNWVALTNLISKLISLQRDRMRSDTVPQHLLGSPLCIYPR